MPLRTFLLLLLLPSFLVNTVQAVPGAGGETCIGVLQRDGNCPGLGTWTDPMTNDELARYDGSFVYSRNNNGCWLYGRIEEKVSGQYGFDFTGINTPGCSFVINTEITYCIGTCPTRRHLMTDDDSSLTPADEEYQQHAQQCAHAPYQVSLVIVDTHFYGVATPEANNNNNKDSSCPSLVTGATFTKQQQQQAHSNATTELEPYRKDLKILKHDDEKKFWLEDQESLPMGTFTLSQLQAAHEQVDPSSANHDGGYDIIQFNCADYLLALASELKMEWNARQTVTFVVRRLLWQDDTNLASQIRNSVHYASTLWFGKQNRGLLRNNKQNDDQEVVQAVVEYRMADFLHKKKN